MTKRTPKEKWRPDGLHGGVPCPAAPNTPRIGAVDNPMPTTLWERKTLMPPPRMREFTEVRRNPPRTWLGNVRRGWTPFKAQVCSACGGWRALPPDREPPLHPLPPRSPPATPAARLPGRDPGVGGIIRKKQRPEDDYEERFHRAWKKRRQHP